MELTLEEIEALLKAIGWVFSEVNYPDEIYGNLRSKLEDKRKGNNILDTTRRFKWM